MNFFIKIAGIIYHSFDDKGVDIPHFRTIVTIVLCLFLHVVHIGLFFNIPSNYIMPWDFGERKSIQWLFGSIYFGLLIAIVSFAFRKSKLDKINVSQKQMDRARIILPVYLTISILLLLVLLIKKGITEGKINL